MRRRDPSKDSGNGASSRADYSIDLSVLHNLMTSHPSHHQWPLATQTISSPLMTLCTYVNNPTIDAFTVHAKLLSRSLQTLSLSFVAAFIT